jgi:hypothetical protein
MSDVFSQLDRQITIILFIGGIVSVFSLIMYFITSRDELAKIVNQERGFSWEMNQEWGSMDYGDAIIAPVEKGFLEAKLKHGLKVIENKYKDKDDPVSKQNEIDELTQFIDKLKTHLQNRRVFPRDPEKQTELEKMIINAPPIPPGDHDYSVMVLQDPESGMYFSRISGCPAISPDMIKEYWEWVSSTM